MPDIFNSSKVNKNKSERLNLSEDVKRKKLSPKKMSAIAELAKDGFTHNPLACFSVHPDRIKFTAADPEEKIVLLLRKHPITNLKWVIVAMIAVILPPFFSLFDLYNILPLDYRFVINLLWYLFVTAYILEKFLQWFFNVNVITDERIIDVDFHNLIYREISDANIDQIQDVSVGVGGGIRTLLNYGNVTVQTAAEVINIDLTDVPRPDDVAKILRELRVEEEMEKLEGRVR